MKELNKSELISITGGGPITGFLLAAYVDFEIGLAIGIKNAFNDFFNF